MASSSEIRVAIVGDRDLSSSTHAATEQALGHAAAALRRRVAIAWVPTEELRPHVARSRLGEAHAILAAPGSPYRSMDGALEGIRFAREALRPLLAT